MLSDSYCIVKVQLFWDVFIQSDMLLSVWFILYIFLHVSRPNSKNPNWMSDLVPPGLNLNSKVEQFPQKACDSVLFAQHVNVSHTIRVNL